jgi:plastocyanin
MQTNTFLATLLTVVLAAGCDSDTGDDESTGTPVTSTMPPTSTPTSGDEDTMDPTATGGADVVNGCDPAMAVDMKGMAEVTIVQTGLTYAPACVKISAGTSVKFTSDFVAHPLVGGVYDGAKMPDAGSPITPTSTGAEASFTIAAAGTYGYYCDLHAASNMIGAIIAE